MRWRSGPGRAPQTPAYSASSIRVALYSCLVSARRHNVTTDIEPCRTPEGVEPDEAFEAVSAAVPAPAPEVVMTAALWLALVIGAPTVGIGIYDLQTKLERWAYQRHAED